MTTTLRPWGREEPMDGGGRSRWYDVCVNGRPVGTVGLTAREQHGVVAGRIVALTVEPADRRRGRATVAALAAEEVLRGWGCARIEIGVPADAAGALALAGALGYTESNRHLLKRLAAEPPDLPPDSSVAAMTADGYQAWRERDRAKLARILAGRGVPPLRAAAEAGTAHEVLLPDGPATTGMALRTLVHAGTPAGGLCLRLDGAPRADADAWVYAVDVPEEHRGRGHGRSLMLAAERECAAAGLRVLGLNVLAGNTPARRLYDSLGYRTAEVHLAKPLC